MSAQARLRHEGCGHEARSKQGNVKFARHANDYAKGVCAGCAGTARGILNGMIDKPTRGQKLALERWTRDQIALGKLAANGRGPRAMSSIAWQVCERIQGGAP